MTQEQVSKKDPDDQYVTVWVASFKHKSGRIIYARNYGKKAFPIRVPKRPSK
jgi:hypothetical protein